MEMFFNRVGWFGRRNFQPLAPGQGVETISPSQIRSVKFYLSKTVNSILSVRGDHRDQQRNEHNISHKFHLT